MRISPILILALLVYASAAICAEPEPAVPEGAGAAGTEQPAGVIIPDIDVNQAERLQPADPEAPIHPGLVAEGERAPSPLMVEIRSVLAAADAEAAELESRLAGARDDMAALEILRSIEQVRVRAELDVLAVQADFARRSGREDIAQEIDAAIGQMTGPKPAPQPVDRPAPADGNR